MLTVGIKNINYQNLVKTKARFKANAIRPFSYSSLETILITKDMFWKRKVCIKV